jgi:hypothetical protein
VEIRSPDDETYEKLPFYAKLGVPELLVVHPESKLVELYALDSTAYRRVQGDTTGAVHVRALDVRLTTTTEPALRIEWDGGSQEIR